MEIAGASLAVIPIVIVVIVLQRYFVQSTTMSGMKG
jgi:ABC-type glycerol-3-phosphate transport system permease component